MLDEKQVKELRQGIQTLPKNIEEIEIDYLLYDVMIIKAESLKYDKIFNYADHLEKQLLQIKRKQAELHL